MDYLHNKAEGITRYHASDMILMIVSDAFFLVLSQARSRSSIVYYLEWKYKDKINGAGDVLFQTIKDVLSSASEAKTGGV